MPTCGIPTRGLRAVIAVCSAIQVVATVDVRATVLVTTVRVQVATPEVLTSGALESLEIVPAPASGEGNGHATDCRVVEIQILHEVIKAIATSVGSETDERGRRIRTAIAVAILTVVSVSVIAVAAVLNEQMAEAVWGITASGRETVRPLFFALPSRMEGLPILAICVVLVENGVAPTKRAIADKRAEAGRVAAATGHFF